MILYIVHIRPNVGNRWFPNPFFQPQKDIPLPTPSIFRCKFLLLVSGRLYLWLLKPVTLTIVGGFNPKKYA